jgi:hypothetical protein
MLAAPRRSFGTHFIERAWIAGIMAPNPKADMNAAVRNMMSEREKLIRVNTVMSHRIAGIKTFTIPVLVRDLSMTAL